MGEDTNSVDRYGLLGRIDRARLGLLDDLDHSPLAKDLGAAAAQKVGQSIGLVTGAAKSAKGVVDGGIFLGRLINPLDTFFSAPGQSARAQLGEAGATVFRRAQEAAAHPEQVSRAIRRKAHEARIALDPSATPVSQSFSDELGRNFRIGLNQGELMFDLASLVYGGVALKGLKGAAAVSEADAIAKFVSQGSSLKAARYLAEPYEGMGAHYFPRTIPKKLGDVKIPEFVRRFHLPQPLSDSMFNVLKPKNINRGDMYELHYKVDDRFSGTGLPARFGKERWSGKKAGIKRYPLAARLWFGAPAPLKASASGIELGGVGFRHREEEE